MDLDDPPACDRELEYDARPSALSPHGPGGSIDQSRLRDAGTPREGACDRRRTADFPRGAHLHGFSVGSEDDVRVEHREKRIEVTAPRGGEEGVDDFSLTGEIAVGHRGRSLHSAAGAARELPCRGRGASHDRSDLVERQVEQVVQHERDPLGGSQRFEHNEQRQSDRVGQERFVLGVDAGLAARDRRGREFAQGLLVPRLARFRSCHPEIDVLVSADNRMVDLERTEVDLVVRFTKSQRVPDHAVRLFGERVIPVATGITLLPPGFHILARHLRRAGFDARVARDIRSARLRKLLANDPALVTWLYPNDDETFTPEQLPDAAFRPLTEWVQYVLDHDHEMLQVWIQAASFDFEQFICEEEEAPRPKKPPPEKSRPDKRGRKSVSAG